MIDGRHCTNKDLNLLIKETEKVKTNLSSFEIEKYLKLIERFDKEIAINLKMEIECASSKDKIINIIDKNINELIQNVVVDINEHN